MDAVGRALPTFEAAAAAIVAAGRRLGARRLVAGTDGNLSIRLDARAIAVTPSGRRKDELSAGDVLAIALDASLDQPAGGGPARPRPTSDLAVHRAVYAARPDAHAIAHAHPPAVLACLLAGLRPDPAVLPEARAVLGQVAEVPALPFGSAAVAAATAEALRDPAVGAVLLGGHGALAVGRTLDEAVGRLEVLDLLCATWHAAWLSRGDPRRRAARRPRAGAASRTPPSLRRRP